MPYRFTNACSNRGSDMGRPTVLPDGPAKLHLERVRMVDGDYDKGGAYWGGYPSAPLYVAWNEDGVQIFVRAKSRDDAKSAVRQFVSTPVDFHRIPGERNDTNLTAK